MMKKFNFAYGGDLGMVALLVAVLSLMVFPLPTFLIDALLAVNMTISVLLLMVTLYMPNAVALSSFPSLLLFTTLLRLSLNIASTKMILLHADAGHIIDAFGKLVVGGNLVVGIVVFMIITIVQFIVIAKGSERVAEVGARFTLDAMPGKQMSIDADLRAGYLSGDDARRKRAELAMESQLHGGMDGAMKFVKGDAVAGLIITAVNILAGIVVGVTFHAMSAGEAANRFAVLSIGDAMVSQIPSLLISVAAGVLITRVSDEHAKKPKSLGDEITAQLSANPRALYTAALFLLGFAAVPGFPWLVFLLLSAGLAAGGFLLSRKGGRDGGSHQALQRDGAKADSPGIEAQPPAFACPLALALSPGLGAVLSTDALNTAFERERRNLQDELGLPFPGIRLWTLASLPDNHYQILVHDVPSSSGELRPGKALVLEPEERWQSECEVVRSPDGAPDAHWLALPHPQAAAAELRLLSVEDVLARHAVGVLRDNAHQFVGIQEVQWVMERVVRDYPGLVAEVQKVLPLQRIAEVLRRLLEEHVSIRNMRSIFEALIVWGPKEKDVVMLTEQVRGELGRYLVHRATGGGGSLAVVLLEPPVEKLIRESIKPTPAGNFLAMAPEHMAHIAQSIAALVEQAPAGLAVVTAMDIRCYVRRIVDARMKGLRVYSFQELGNQVTLEPVGQVGL